MSSEEAEFNIAKWLGEFNLTDISEDERNTKIIRLGIIATHTILNPQKIAGIGINNIIKKDDVTRFMVYHVKFKDDIDTIHSISLLEATNAIKLATTNILEHARPNTNNLDFKQMVDGITESLYTASVIDVFAEVVYDYITKQTDT